jgi:hypothetical protein
MNEDKNLLGRVGAVVVIIAVAVGLGRICGVGTGMCLFSSPKSCCAAPSAPAAPSPK